MDSDIARLTHDIEQARPPWQLMQKASRSLKAAQRKVHAGMEELQARAEEASEAAQAERDARDSLDVARADLARTC